MDAGPPWAPVVSSRASGQFQPAGSVGGGVRADHGQQRLPALDSCAAMGGGGRPGAMSPLVIGADACISCDHRERPKFRLVPTSLASLLNIEDHASGQLRDPRGWSSTALKPRPQRKEKTIAIIEKGAKLCARMPRYARRWWCARRASSATIRPTSPAWRPFCARSRAPTTRLPAPRHRSDACFRSCASSRVTAS